MKGNPLDTCDEASDQHGTLNKFRAQCGSHQPVFDRGMLGYIMGLGGGGLEIGSLL
jgi:hypothetical protein